MKKIYFRRGVSLLLALLFSINLMVSGYGLDAVESEPTTDGAAFGILAEQQSIGDMLYAWTNDAESTADMKALLNSQTLHPQRTGWLELDALMEDMIAEAGENATTYDKLWYMYDWLVKNVTYSWSGYSYTTASVKSYNSFTKLDYLSGLTYEEGLEKSIPDDMANRTYHILTAKKGVCYDYAIAIAVIARYIGIESYVHTGLFVFEDTSNGYGHHGWGVLMLDGEKYVFDPQRDARNYQYYRRNGYYFGIAEENANRYLPNYSNSYVGDNKTANAERDASMLPVDADRAHMVTVAATVTGSGSAVFSGVGNYITGNTATVTAISENDDWFMGWYDSDGNLLTLDTSYTFTVTDDTVLTAEFEAHVTPCPVSGFNDLIYDKWYHRAVDFVLDEKIFLGTSSTTFEPDTFLTRGMLATLLYRMSGDSCEAAEVFPDVSLDAWYAQAVTWAQQEGIFTGFTDGTFQPDTEITREQMVTVFYRYAQWSGVEVTASGDLASFADGNMTGLYAQEAMGWAVGSGLIQGTSVNGKPRLLPLNNATRAEVAQVFMNYYAGILGVDISLSASEEAAVTYSVLFSDSEAFTPTDGADLGGN